MQEAYAVWPTVREELVGVRGRARASRALLERRARLGTPSVLGSAASFRPAHAPPEDVDALDACWVEAHAAAASVASERAPKKFGPDGLSLVASIIRLGGLMRRTIQALVLPVLAAFCGVVACGGGDESAGGSAPVDLAPKYTELSQHVCDLAFRCCTRGEVSWYLAPYIDAAGCPGRFVEHAALSSTASIDLEQVLGVHVRVPNLGAASRAVSEGRVQIDEAALVTCFAYLQNLPCNKYEEKPEGCVPPDPPPDETPCEPEKIFIGKVKEQGRCTSSLGSMECQPGLGCRTDGELGVFGQCVKLSDVGEHCVSDSECLDKLYCSQLDGTCRVFRNQGETCLFADPDDPDPDPQTALIRCRADLSCNPLTDTCVAACQRGAKCASDAFCDEAQKLECVTGRCDLPRAKGLPCAEDDDCEKNLICKPDPADPSENVCSSKSPLNSACVSHDDCASGFCEPILDRCEVQLPPGSLCPSNLSQQCADGRCVKEQITCFGDTDCTSSKKCNTITNQCSSYCVALLPEGAACAVDSDCATDHCIAGFCRNPPLANGAACDGAADCESEFCSLDVPSVCKELPLPLGDPCSASSQCDSGVCFAQGGTLKKICISGLDEDEECGKPQQAPCSPKKFYCDGDKKPPVCVPLKETGEACTGDIQCRGNCTLKHSRMLCDTTPPPKAALCDGA